MLTVALLNSFSRLAVGNTLRHNVRAISTCKPLLFKTTPCLLGEPMKKKKKLDPAIVRQREERKKRKIEKQIRRLAKHQLQLKPIDELEIPEILIDEKSKRTRKPTVYTPEQIESIDMLQKEWTRYKRQENIDDITMIDRIVSSQRKALEALKEVSEDLYNAALEVDPKLVPYCGKGPVATPPIKNYDSPDGEYTDVSRKWEN